MRSLPVRAREQARPAGEGHAPREDAEKHHIEVQTIVNDVGIGGGAGQAADNAAGRTRDERPRKNVKGGQNRNVRTGPR